MGAGRTAGPTGARAATRATVTRHARVSTGAARAANRPPFRTVAALATFTTGTSRATSAAVAAAAIDADSAPAPGGTANPATAPIPAGSAAAAAGADGAARAHFSSSP